MFPFRISKQLPNLSSMYIQEEAILCGSATHEDLVIDIMVLISFAIPRVICL